MNYMEIINIIQWLASLIVLLLCFYVMLKSPRPLQQPVIALLASTGVWCFFAALTFSVETLEVKIFLNRLKMLGPIFMPFCILQVASSANSDLKTPIFFRRFILSFAIFYCVLMLSPFHELMITNYGVKEVGGFSILTFANGPLFFFHNVLARVVIVAAFIILTVGYKHRHLYHTKNNLLVLVAFFIPFMIDNVGVFFYDEIRFYQLVPVAFTFTGAILVYLLLHRRVLEVVPYTRSKIVDSLIEPCFMWDNDGKLVDCNRAAADLFDIKDSLLEFDEKTFPSLKKYNSEIFYKGSYFKVNFQTFDNSGKESDGAFTILNDITSEKKLALEMQKLDQVKSGLLGILSHDLTGHIGQLSFISEILSKDLEKLSQLDREQLSKNLGLISEDVRVFIQDILEWSKEQNGEWAQGKESFNVEKLLVSVVSFMKPIAESRGINIHVLESEKVEIKTDQMMSSTIFRNLIYNAIKHSPDETDIFLRLEKDALYISNTTQEEVAQKLNDFIQNDQAVLSGGLGLKLVREFASILNMSVHFSHFESSLTARVSWL